MKISMTGQGVIAGDALLTSALGFLVRGLQDWSECGEALSNIPFESQSHVADRQVQIREKCVSEQVQLLQAFCET